MVDNSISPLRTHFGLIFSSFDCIIGLFLIMMTLPALLPSILPTPLVFCQTANQHAAHCYSHPNHHLFPNLVVMALVFCL